MSLSKLETENPEAIIAYYDKNLCCENIGQQKIIFDQFFDICQTSAFNNWPEKTKLASLACIKSFLTTHDSVLLGVSSTDRLVALCFLAGLQHDSVDKDTIVSREALKCIANSLLIVQELRSSFCGLSSASLIFERIATRTGVSTEALFLYSRILFLSTSGPSTFLKGIVENNMFDKVVLEAIAALEKEKESSYNTCNYTNMLVTELLKVTFSLLVNFPKCFTMSENSVIFVGEPADYVLKKFESLFIPLLRFASLEERITPDEIFHSIIPILINFPKEFFLESLLPTTVSLSNISSRSLKCVKSVAETNRYHTDSEPEYERIIPHILLLDFISSGSAVNKQFISKALLPSDADRSHPIGVGDSVTARLAAVLSAPSFSAFKGALCELFFSLCDQNAETMAKIFGYGNVAGFLVNKNLASEAFSNNTNQSNNPIKKDINPISGQYCSSESKAISEPMTEEEKLREAERLFVLFEHIKRNPAIQLQNPVEQAFHAGKFAEMTIEDESD